MEPFSSSRRMRRQQALGDRCTRSAIAEIERDAISRTQNRDIDGINGSHNFVQ